MIRHVHMCDPRFFVTYLAFGLTPNGDINFSFVPFLCNAEYTFLIFRKVAEDTLR